MHDTLNDMQQYLVDEFVEDYQTGLMSRRDALRRIAAITGSMAMATTILAACGPAESTATTGTATASGGATASTATAGGSPAAPSAGDPSVTVAENDPAITAEMIEFPGLQGATLMGYLARPSAEGKAPIILVCHENRGLTPHIQDVTRRLAKAGYVGLAVDLLSRQGGTAKVGDPAAVPGVLGNLPEGQPAQDFHSGLRYVQNLPFADNLRVGMVGFCYGGGVTWRVATLPIPELRAVVPFYGPPPAASAVPSIDAAVLAVYAEQDERINRTIPEIEAAMQQNNKVFEKQIYPGVDHAFHNDTGQRYNPEQAKAAWARTLAWFEQYVKA